MPPLREIRELDLHASEKNNYSEFSLFSLEVPMADCFTISDREPSLPLEETPYTKYPDFLPEEHLIFEIGELEFYIEELDVRNIPPRQETPESPDNVSII